MALIFCASTSGKQFDAISPQCPVAPGTGQKANPSRDARGAPRATERQVISAALAVSGRGSAPGKPPGGCAMPDSHRQGAWCVRQPVIRRTTR